MRLFPWVAKQNEKQDALEVQGNGFNSSAIWSLLDGGSRGNESDEPVTDATALSVATVFTACRVLADGIASLPCSNFGRRTASHPWASASLQQSKASAIERSQPNGTQTLQKLVWLFACSFLCGLRTWSDEQSGISEIPNAYRVHHCHQLCDRSSGCWPSAHLPIHLVGPPVPTATCSFCVRDFHRLRKIAARV
jgi:hypothetical protein